VKLKILRSASEDLQDGYRFYERQSPGAGDYFIDSLFSDIDSLALNGGIHPIYKPPFHRMLSKRFPYAIFYRMDGPLVIVYAVLDSRRDPKWLDRRLLS
jgi:plasmid stabilization system protein ParE